MLNDASVNLINLIHNRALSYEAKLETIMDKKEKDQLKGVVLGLKEAIEIIASQERKKTV